jgi:hypothetical protein
MLFSAMASRLASTAGSLLITCGSLALISGGPGAGSGPEASGGAGAGDELGRAIALFLLVTFLLGLFLIVLTLVLVWHLRRQRAERLEADHATESPLVDPWAESGRRAEPFGAPEDQTR